MMTGMLMMLWAAPTLTAGRALLAAAMTAYILVAVRWLEERDLRRAFGEKYARYQSEVPMVLPLRMPRAAARALRSARTAAASTDRTPGAGR